MQAAIRDSEANWAISGSQVPAVALEIEPGDLMVFNHNTKHAAFGGGKRRRMFTINCGQRVPQEQIQLLKDYIAGHARFWLDRLYGEKMMASAGPGRMIHLEQGCANDGHLAELSAAARAERPEPSRG